MAHSNPHNRKAKEPLGHSASLDSSAPLDSPTPLEADYVVEPAVQHPVRSTTPPPVAPFTPAPTVETMRPTLHPDQPPSYPARSPQPMPAPAANVPPPVQPVMPTAPPIAPIAPPQTTTESVSIPLLEERLVVDRKKRKVGEVIVRKEIETRIVEVPVRRETLIIEQVSPEHKQLASFAVGEPDIDRADFAQSSAAESSPTVVTGEFDSIQTASHFLASIAGQPDPGCQKVQLKLVVTNPELRSIYQQWLDRYLANG